jgi:hypothetical protein|uniref:Uncharacterized protein n=1 Tax=Siphoviridae sp. ctXZx16 TaxID=2826371 RepID=A0A8S5MLZ0_9CAUD|nr:MAG TPA: hypothetical protein [Siphoviridae sp. ctXZx16]
MLSTTPKELIAKYKDDNPGLYCFLFDLYFYMEEDETINIIPDNILLSIGNSSLNLSQKMAIGTFISDWILDEDESKFDRMISIEELNFIYKYCSYVWAKEYHPNYACHSECEWIGTGYDLSDVVEIIYLNWNNPEQMENIKKLLENKATAEEIYKAYHK